jgi:MinD-like ATPase involved in chromosome partitioning or flagellar assembly
VPSDRDIPRSINEGVPIVHSKAKSEAARAFRDLAASYHSVERPVKNGRVRLFRRKR